MLSGSRFRGGSFNGWRLFRAIAAACFSLVSEIFDPAVHGPVGAKDSVVPLTVVKGRLEFELRVNSISSGKLDLRALVGNTSSYSVFGDS